MDIILNNADYSIVIPEMEVTFTYGKVQSGTIVSDSTQTRAISDYIDVRNGNYIVGVFSDFLYSSIDFVFFDENKNQISTSSNSTVYRDTSSASYIRFSAKRTDGSTFDLDDIASSFSYRLTNVYSNMFNYGGFSSGGAQNYNTARLSTNLIALQNTKVSVSLSNSNFSVVEVTGWDSNQAYVGKVAQNSTISSSVAYVSITIKNTNNYNIIFDTFQDSEITITWSS